MASENAFVRLAGKLRWAVQQRGLRDTLRVIVERLRHGRSKPLATHPFDLEHGTDTSGLIGGRDLRSGHAHDIHSTAYFGTPPSRLRAAIARWQSVAGVPDLSGYTFLDIGSGKGRALLVASELGFREVVGVEINADLARTAMMNIELWRASHAAAAPALSPTRVVQGDATEVALSDGPALLYLYNPFRAPVLRALLSRIVALRSGAPAPLHVLYLYPEQAVVFDEFPQFQQLWTGTIPLAPGAPPDGVSSAEDPCNLYRQLAIS